MSLHEIFGWFLVAIGGLQAVAAFRGHRSAGKGTVLIGLGLMSMGVMQLLRDSGPALRVGSLALVTVITIAQAASRRRELPREFLVISSLMVLLLVFGVVDAFGYGDEPLVEKAFVVVFGAVFLALVGWVGLTVLRSLNGAFRPNVRRPGD